MTLAIKAQEMNLNKADELGKVNNGPSFSSFHNLQWHMSIRI